MSGLVISLLASFAVGFVISAFFVLPFIAVREVKDIARLSAAD